MGSQHKLMIWKDVWVDELPLMTIFFRLFILAKDKDMFIEDIIS